MEWYEELGFGENPFGNSPGFAARFAVGLEGPLEELEYYVDSGSAGFVEGPFGSGKSVLLWKLADKLRGRTVYFDCFEGELDVRSIIRKKTSFLDRLFGKNPRDIVLLIDNAAGLSPVAMGLLKYHYDNNHLGAIVFAGTSLKSAGLSPALADRIGSRIVRLTVMSGAEAVRMVKNRLGSSNILSEAVISKFYKLSGGNPKKFLQLCEKACKAAVASDLSTITDEHLKLLRIKNMIS